MSPIPKFARSVWEEAKKNPKTINANIAFYRFFELSQDDPKTKPGFDNMMKIDLESQCAHLFFRQVEQIEGLKAQGWEAEHWIEVTQSRLACGLGIPHPSGNGLLLDRVSGAPYLAGTGLKGITLDLAIEKLEDAQGEEKEKGRAIIRAVFGADPTTSSDDSAYKGCVHFFDAFPDVTSSNGKRPFQIDVINPHYREYYGEAGKTPPADYLAPVPSFFLTVRQGVPFRFALAARGSRCRLEEEGETGFTAKELLETTKAWLKSALMELGAGGKTRVGYGTFGTYKTGGGSK